MGLKSLIGKIVPINGAVNYSDVKKNVIYEKYPSKNDFQSSKKLEEIFIGKNGKAFGFDKPLIKMNGIIIFGYIGKQKHVLL